MKHIMTFTRDSVVTRCEGSRRLGKCKTLSLIRSIQIDENSIHFRQGICDIVTLYTIVEIGGEYYQFTSIGGSTAFGDEGEVGFSLEKISLDSLINEVKRYLKQDELDVRNKNSLQHILEILVGL